MKPPLPRIESAVPQTSHVQLEIAKAVRTLFGSDDGELLRRRRAEIAELRSDLNALVRDISKAFEAAAALAKAELRTALRKPAAGLTANLTFQKASPDDAEHPGWPAGTPGGRGGKFRPKDDDGASESGGGSSANSTNAEGDRLEPRYAARDSGTLTDETNGVGARASSAAGPGNDRAPGASGYPTAQAAHGLPDPPTFDTYDSALLEPGGDPPDPRAKTQFRKELNYRLDDDAQYAAGVTIINEDDTLAGALNRALRVMLGGNPVDVEFRATIDTADGTIERTFRITAFLPVYGWRSVPWAAFGPLQGPGKVKIEAFNHTSFVTGVIAGANRMKPTGK
jgi:hypothetical protein